MRFLVTFLLLSIFSSAVAYDVNDLENPVQWMYQNGLTKYDTVKSYNPDNAITRQEAAKIFGEFATKIFWKKPSLDSAKCQWKDINEVDPTLKDSVVQSCRLGIFQGSNGYFRPKDPLTLAQAMAVGIRVVYAKMDEKSETPWYKQYAEKLKEWQMGGAYIWGGDMDWLDDSKASRWAVSKLLFELKNLGWVDIPTFQVLAGGLYTKDKNNVYFKGQTLSGISMVIDSYGNTWKDKTFRVLYGTGDYKNDYGKDSFHIFKWADLIDGFSFSNTVRPYDGGKQSAQSGSVIAFITSEEKEGQGVVALGDNRIDCVLEETRNSTHYYSLKNMLWVDKASFQILAWEEYQENGVFMGYKVAKDKNTYYNERCDPIQVTK